MKVLKDDEEVVITGKELAKHRDICRKEGAISELKRFLNRVAWDGTTETEYVKKRLKELGGKK